MTLQISMLARHSNAYHQSESLLFQFILSEFLEAYRETRLLALKRHSVDELKLSVPKLTGTPQEHHRIFPWRHQQGLLPKLKNYCTLFTQNADCSEKEMIALHYYADKAWAYFNDAVELLNDIDKDHAPLFAVVEKGCNALQRFARLIARLLPQFRDDENVIFFVLRHHEQFDVVYGHRFVTKLFGRMYSKGLKETGHFLNKKYSHRGFDSLLELVSAKISELESVHHDDVEKSIC